MRGGRRGVSCLLRQQRKRCVVVLVSRNSYTTVAPHNPLPGEHTSSPLSRSPHSMTTQEVGGGVAEDHHESSHHGSEHDHHDHHGSPYDKHRSGWRSLSDDYPNYNVSIPVPGTSEKEMWGKIEHKYKYIFDPFHTPMIFPDVYSKEGQAKLKANEAHDHGHHDYDPYAARPPVNIYAGYRIGEFIWERTSDWYWGTFILVILMFVYAKYELVTFNWREWSLIELQRRAEDKFENNSQGKADKWMQLEVPVSRFPKIPKVQEIWNHTAIRRFDDAHMSVLCRGAEMRAPNYLTPKHEVEAYRAKQRGLWEKKKALREAQQSEQ